MKSSDSTTVIDTGTLIEHKETKQVLEVVRQHHRGGDVVLVIDDTNHYTFMNVHNIRELYNIIN